MKCSLNKLELLEYVVAQINTFFPDRKGDFSELNRYWDLILDRTEYCFSKNISKYFHDEDGVIFDHLNGDQYSMFLYFASNTIYSNQSDLRVCTKLFQLNRLLHGIDVFYEVELPDIFLFSHPIGTVLGRAKYSNYFYVLQNCNVGGAVDNGKLFYPVLGEYTTMQSGSFILGNCVIGENCMIAPNSLLLNMNLDDNNFYAGNPKNYIIRKREIRDYNWE